jgi:hypothetical protein
MEEVDDVGKLTKARGMDNCRLTEMCVNLTTPTKFLIIPTSL